MCYYEEPQYSGLEPMISEKCKLKIETAVFCVVGIAILIWVLMILWWIL